MHFPTREGGGEWWAVEAGKGNLRKAKWKREEHTHRLREGVFQWWMPYTYIERRGGGGVGLDWMSEWDEANMSSDHAAGCGEQVRKDYQHTWRFSVCYTWRERYVEWIVSAGESRFSPPSTHSLHDSCRIAGECVADCTLYYVMHCGGGGAFARFFLKEWKIADRGRTRLGLRPPAITVCAS